MTTFWQSVQIGISSANKSPKMSKAMNVGSSNSGNKIKTEIEMKIIVISHILYFCYGAW